MKRIIKILVFAFVVLVSFSCGKKDGPVPTPHQQNIAKTWTIAVKGFAGQNVTLPEVSITLSDIPGIEVSDFISGEFQNSGSYILLSGLDKLSGAELENFTIQINNSTPVNFGKVTATPGTNDFGSDIQQSGNRELQFLSNVFNAYAGKGKTATLKISFKPTKDIVTENNVHLNITINGKYNWNTFDN